MRPAQPTLVLRRARLFAPGGAAPGLFDVEIAGGRVAAVVPSPGGRTAAREADLGGRMLLPGLVNAHDHLDLSTFPPLGRPPYTRAAERDRDVEAAAGSPEVAAALQVPGVDRLLLGGLRNLVCGVTGVLHHGPFHRSLQRDDFPVRVQRRYQFALSPGLDPLLRRSYRSTDRRIPWLVHAGEGTDEASRAEIDALAEQNVLRQNTVVVHGIAFGAPEAGRLASARAAVVWCPEANLREFGKSADVRTLRAAGVRVGLGSDGPTSGARDPLSNLAAAAAAGVLDPAGLILLATRDSAEVARLPVGGFEPGSPADLLAVPDLASLLAGARQAVELVVVAGEPRYGAPELLGELGVRAEPIEVDGALRSLAAGLARDARRALRGTWLGDVPWLRGLGL